MITRTKERLFMVIMFTVISLFCITLTEPIETSAASKYIKSEEFIKSLVEELNIPIDNDSYVDAAIKVGIVKEDDTLSSDLTRADIAVLLNRADEYLYGETLDQELVTLALEKQISDIDSVDKGKRIDVVKCYLKGFIKGYSNGDYSIDREFRGDKKISRKGALDTIKMLKNKSLRAKISPDGQLIRTTKLPKNAELFPYILASYPNKYYEWELQYQTTSRLMGDEDLYEITNLVDYASPVDIGKLDIDNYDDFEKIKKDRLNDWVENAKRHLELLFSVDYRTIGDEWYNDILKTNYQYGTAYEWFPKKKIDAYLEKMIPNKTIVEYEKIAIDGSSLYFYDNSFYMRIYAKYKIASSKDLSIPDGNTPSTDWSYDKILFNYGFAIIEKVKLGEWREGYYDIELADYNSEGNLGVNCLNIYPGQELN